MIIQIGMKLFEVT